MQIEGDSIDYGRGERLIHFSGEFNEAELQPLLGDSWIIEEVTPETDFRGLINPAAIYLTATQKWRDKISKIDFGPMFANPL